MDRALYDGGADETHFERSFWHRTTACARSSVKREIFLLVPSSKPDRKLLEAHTVTIPHAPPRRCILDKAREVG